MARSSATSSYSVWWPVEPDQALADWHAHHMTGPQPFSPAGQYGTSISYQHTVEGIPTWAVVLCILGLPFCLLGLFFLLAKESKTQTLTITFAPADPGTGTWVTATCACRLGLDP